MGKNNIYFVSDCHLGVPDYITSLKREKLLVKWLNEIKDDAKEIYLLGDIFDFWFEYKTVVPKGYVRLLGKLAELSDSGIVINFFTGNHDMWIKDYFEKELNFIIYRNAISKQYNGLKFYIAHGDGLGPNDLGYKFLKKIFSNPFCRWVFSILHPTVGYGIANYFSRKSRIANENYNEIYLGEEKERLIVFSKEILQREHYDFFIFGHRHLPIDIKLGEKSRYINLGDWVTNFTYIEFDGEQLLLKKYSDDLNTNKS